MEESIDARSLAREKGDVFIIDIRREPDDAQIPGSLRYDGEALADAALLPFRDDAKLVLYCGGGNSRSRVAGELRARGFDARALDGGYKAWKEAGLPTEPIGAGRAIWDHARSDRFLVHGFLPKREPDPTRRHKPYDSD